VTKAQDAEKLGSKEVETVLKMAAYTKDGGFP